MPKTIVDLLLFGQEEYHCSIHNRPQPLGCRSQSVLLNRYQGPGKLLLAAGIATPSVSLAPDCGPWYHVLNGKMYMVLTLETLHEITYAGSKQIGQRRLHPARVF